MPEVAEFAGKLALSREKNDPIRFLPFMALARRRLLSASNHRRDERQQESLRVRPRNCFPSGYHTRRFWLGGRQGLVPKVCPG